MKMKITRVILPSSSLAWCSWMGPEQPSKTYLTEFPIILPLEPNEDLEDGKFKIEEKVQELLVDLYAKCNLDPVEALVMYRLVPTLDLSGNCKKVISIVSMMLGPEDRLLAYPSDPNSNERDCLPEYLCKSVNSSLPLKPSQPLKLNLPGESKN